MSKTSLTGGHSIVGMSRPAICATRAERAKGLKAQVHARFDTVLVRVAPDTGPNTLASLLLARTKILLL
jgi:hypothetical protein